MWKKGLCLAAGILAVAVLIAGAVASVNADTGPAGKMRPAHAFGRPPGGPGGPGGDEMLTRVAQILTIDKQKLADAFKQAGTELGQKRMDGRFAKLVTDGKLTQAQADQYKAWLQSKPADVPGFGPGPGDSARGNDMMSSLLKDGKITQGQFDAWKTWIGQKPNFDLPKPERPAGAPPCGPGRTGPPPAK